jgi:hypothetical protein
MKAPKLDKQTYQTISQIIAGIGLLALFLLITGLSNLSFNPGQAIPTQEGTFSLFPRTSAVDANWLGTICLTSMLAMFPIGAVLLIFSSEARKIFKKYFRALVLWFIFLLGARFYTYFFRDDEFILSESPSSASLPEVLNPPSLAATATSNIDVYQPPDLPGWGSYLIGFSLVIAIGIIAYLVWERNRFKGSDLGEIAIQALGDIYAGREWEDAIIQCYVQMNRVVSRQRRLDRDIHLTPGEFALRLAEAGLPEDPIQNLTRLFEKARYGASTNQPKDASEAIKCLNAIKGVLEAGE